MKPKLRECLAEPIPAIFEAAEKLKAAVDAHLVGKFAVADQLIKAANDPIVRQFTDIAWGGDAERRYGFKNLVEAPPYLIKSRRPTPRMPGISVRKLAIGRDGHHCRFCGMPVIHPGVRQRMQAAYPEALGWGRNNASQHAAFQCMWLQYDHILPNSRGGASSLQNIVVTCAPCNFGRMQATLEEAWLANPLSRPPPRKWNGFENWDGLESFRS